MLDNFIFNKIIFGIKLKFISESLFKLGSYYNATSVAALASKSAFKQNNVS